MLAGSNHRYLVCVKKPSTKLGVAGSNPAGSTLEFTVVRSSSRSHLREQWAGGRARSCPRPAPGARGVWPAPKGQRFRSVCRLPSASPRTFVAPCNKPHMCCTPQETMIVVENSRDSKGFSAVRRRYSASGRSRTLRA